VFSTLPRPTSPGTPFLLKIAPSELIVTSVLGFLENEFSFCDNSASTSVVSGYEARAVVNSSGVM
jgi:hypothetical protein